jgi:hypothetical protein
MGLEVQNSLNTETPEKPRTSSGRSFLPQLDSRMAWSQVKRCSCSWRDCFTPQSGPRAKWRGKLSIVSYRLLCSISQPPFESTCWSSIHEGTHGFGRGWGRAWRGIGGLGGCPCLPCSNTTGPPFSHRAAAADLRPTAENIVGEHRECVGASSLQSQRGSAPNGPMGTRRAFEDVASAAQ